MRYKVAFTYPGSILLNNSGERYVNETSSAVTAGYATNDSNEVFVVFTEAMRDETQNILSITGYNEANLTSGESWALLDSLAERNNCVYKADTIEELAEKMGVPADTLKQTIETYNGYAESGVDEDFGRSNVVALSEGPYYAIYSIPYVIQIAGGILIDTSARVQDENDQTIVGLYACGEAVGMNLACPPGHGGKSIGSGTIWGMLAAETAVSELG